MAIPVTKKLLITNSASSLVSRMISVGVLLWVNKFLLDQLDAEEFSLYPIIMSVVAFFPLLSAFLTPGIARYIVEADAKGDDRRITQIVSTMFPFVLLTAIVTLIVGLLFTYYIDRILTIDSAFVGDAKLMATILVANVSLNLATLPFSVGIYVRQRFVLSNAIGLGTELMRVTLLLFLLLSVSARVLWLPVAMVASSCVGQLVTLIVSKRLVPALKFRTSEFRWSIAGLLTSFGGWLYLGRISHLIYENADKIILNAFSTAVDVNAFHIGSLADKQIRNTTELGSSPLQPAMTTMHSQGQAERLGSIYLRCNRYALWVTLLIAMPLFVFRTEVIRLYAPSIYSDAATVIALLLMTYPFIYSNLLMSKLAVATANLRSFQLRSIAIHIINLSLTIYFVSHLQLGAIGPALATFIITALGQAMLYWPMAWRMAGVSSSRWVWEVLVPGMTPALAAGSLLYMIKYFDCPESWTRICVYSAVGCLAYVAVLLAFCLRIDEKNDLLTILAKFKIWSRSRSSPVF